MSIGLVVTFDDTFFSTADPTTTGSNPAVSAEVPALYDVAIAGHPYMLDLAGQAGAFHHESIPTLRQVFIEADSLGEKQLNPESLWRFSDTDWSHGAGQRHADLPNSDTSQYWQSKGIDPWTKWQISLLPDTDSIRLSGNTNLACLGVGNYLYVADGNNVAFSTDLAAFTNVAGLPGTAITGIATDGNTVYIAATGHGLYTTTLGAGGAATHFVTDSVTLNSVGYVNGRLMVSEGPSIYNVTSPTPAVLPSALFTHPNPTFTWVGFAEGQAALYAGGASADRSLVYRIGISTDGTTLVAPIMAAPPLIGGETLLGIGAYEGFVFLGTNNGVRLCLADSSGNLSVGSLLLTGQCRCFTGYDRFVWFGWDDYDTTSTGLGRFDLSVESSSGAPAYASDLMTDAQDPVLSVTSFGGKRVFAVSAIGFLVESDNLVAQGTLDSGLITYDLSEDKIALYLTNKFSGELAGHLQSFISPDEGAFIFVGELDEGYVSNVLTVPELLGQSFEIRQVLIRDVDTPSIGPILVRNTFESLETVFSGYWIYVPVLLAADIATHDGTSHPLDVVAERDFLYSLHESSQRVIYQELTTQFPVTLEDLTWTPTHRTVDNTGFNGVALLKLKTV